MLSGDEYYEHKATGHKCRYHPGSALDRLASLNTPGNHNFRRISRIIKCLGDLGFEKYQLPFLLRLAEEIYVRGIRSLVSFTQKSKFTKPHLKQRYTRRSPKLSLRSRNIGKYF